MVCSTKITTLKKSSSSEKYSRANRLKRKLQIIPPNQMFITQYFPYVDKISKILQKNNILKKAFFEHAEELRHFKENITSNNIHGFLKQLFETGILNSSKTNPKKNQYEESFKKFCTYLFIIGKDVFRNFYTLSVIFVFIASSFTSSFYLCFKIIRSVL